MEGDAQFRSMNLNAPAYAQNVPENSSSDVPGGWGPASRDRGPGQPTWQGQPNPNILAANSMPKSYSCPSSPSAQFTATPNKDYAVMYDNSIRPDGSSGGEKCCPERRLVTTLAANQGGWNGMGYLMSDINMTGVPDGTSNTILLIEKSKTLNQSWCGNATLKLGCNPFIWVHHQSQGLVTAWRPINFTGDNSRAAGSMHGAGGANATFADGHVTFLTNSMDLRAYQALSSRNGGEAITDTNY
jgi:prepilin-type processing-associated H-X9-DG protein